MQYYTTVEQSKKLVELGLDPLTSDMYYSFMGERIKDAKDEDFSVSVGLAFAIKGNHFSFKYGYVIPCWSLGALLELMPESYQLTSSKDNKYQLYQLMLINNPRYDWFNTPLEAAYNMVCWLLENSYIK